MALTFPQDQILLTSSHCDLFYLFRGYHTPYSYPIGKSSLSHPLYIYIYIYILNYIPPWNHHSPHEDTPRTGTSCWPREHHRLCAWPFFFKLTIYVLVNRWLIPLFIGFHPNHSRWPYFSCEVLHQLMVNIPMMDVFQPSFWCRISQPSTVWFGKFGDGAIALLT